METMVGSVELEIPESTSSEFTANVGVGKINLTNFDLKNPVQDNNYLHGTSGNGDGIIDLTAEVGNIQVVGF
jgi:hypothetical protein